MGSYLIDSNTVPDYLAGKLSDSANDFIDQHVDEQSVLSLISRIELLGFNAPKADANLLRDFVAESLVIDLNETIILRTIALKKSRKIKPKRRTVPDAIIAATVLVNNLTLLTHNTKNFATVTGLTAMDSYTL